MSEVHYKLKSLKIHFLYAIIILIMLTCIVGGLALYKQGFAIKGLSNASLLLSIVLAVVAILITLWDVAGQKTALFDIKDQINSIKEINDEMKESARTSEGLLESLKDFDSRFRVDFEPMKKVLDDISNNISSNQSTGDNKGIMEAIDELKVMFSEKETDLTKVKETISLASVNLRDIISFGSNFINGLEIGETFSLLELREFIIRSVKKKDRTSRLVINLLMLEDFIELKIRSNEIELVNKDKDIYKKI